MKQSVSKKFAVNACGVLTIDEDGIFISIEDGPTVDVANLLSEFNNKVIKISASYDEDYEEPEVQVDIETGEVL